MCYIDKDALPKASYKGHNCSPLNSKHRNCKKPLQLNIFPELSVKVLKGRTKLKLKCQHCAFAYFI